MLSGTSLNESGCKMQMHLTSEGVGMSCEKEKKVKELAMTH